MQYTHRMIGYTNLCCNLESASDDDVCYASVLLYIYLFPNKTIHTLISKSERDVDKILQFLLLLMLLLK